MVNPKEEKILPNEITRVHCPTCGKSLLRVFTNAKKPELPTTFKAFKESMSSRLKELDTFNKMHKLHINTPYYNLVFNNDHFTNHYDCFTHVSMTGYCKRSSLSVGNLSTILSKSVLGHRPIRMACAINGVDPQELIDWLDANPVLSNLVDGHNIQQLTGTDLWVDVFDREKYNLSLSRAYNTIGSPRWMHFGLFKAQGPSHLSDNNCQYEHTNGDYYHTQDFHISTDIPEDHTAHKMYVRVQPANSETSICLSTKPGYRSEAHLTNKTEGFVRTKFPEKFWRIDPARVMDIVNTRPSDVRVFNG